jgi:outer membrane protein assembly factor BamE (lipoprotein component of BamABCDE complex)
MPPGDMARPIPSVNAFRTCLRTGLLGGLLALAGCGFLQNVPENRGNRVDADQLKELTPGVQTQQDVQALLGSPSSTSTFTNSEWYYISGITRSVPGSFPRLENQRVVAISFDDRGVLKQIRELGPQDGKPLEMVDRETPVPGTDRTLLQALFGNIGRVGAAGLSNPVGPGTGPGTGR